MKLKKCKQSYKSKLLIYAILFFSLINLNGCGPLIVASAAGTFAVIADRRTTGTIIEDNTIELKAFKKLHEDEYINKNSKITVNSYNERVLLTGEAKNQQVKNYIIDAIQEIPKVRTIYNEINVADNDSLSTSSYDTWLTTKIKAQMTADSRVNPLNIKVTTENKVVYLMGLVTSQEADDATDVARRVSGVRKVVKLFEYLDTNDIKNSNKYALK